MGLARRLAALVALAVGGAVAAGNCPASAQTTAEPSPEIVAGARQEGRLASFGMPADRVALAGIFRLLADKYGILHSDTDIGAAEQITRLIGEQDAPATDVGDVGYDAVGRLLESRLTAPYKPAGWDRIPEAFRDPDGNWSVAYWGAVAFLVDIDKVRDVPAGWNDLLRPAYRDMVCARDPRSSGAGAVAVLAAAYANGGGEHDPQPGLDWLQRLRDGGNLRPGVEPDLAAVRRADCPIALVYDFDALAMRDAAGRRLMVVIPSDGTVGMPFAQYVSAVAPHPDAARLAIDVLQSDEGQALLAAGYVHPVRPVALPPEVAARLLPQSAYGAIHFPAGLASFSAALRRIAEGWNALAGG
jgi:putative spermidine/putrescine transport system substrate-binding protein